MTETEKKLSLAFRRRAKSLFKIPVFDVDSLTQYFKTVSLKEKLQIRIVYLRCRHLHEGRFDVHAKISFQWNCSVYQIKFWLQKKLILIAENLRACHEQLITCEWRKICQLGAQMLINCQNFEASKNQSLCTPAAQLSDGPVK